MATRVLFLLACATLAAQEIQEPTLRITVTMVQVDAVVTDRQGRHVANLNSGDFQIFEDGKPQKITYFSYVPGAAPPLRTAARTHSGKTVPTVVPGGSKSTPESTRRTVALVVDDLGMSFESTHHVRENLRKFVDEQMQPGDLVAILRTGIGVGALQQFTTDKRVLYAAIDRIRWNIRSRTGPFIFNSTGYNPVQAEVQQTVDSGEHTSEFSRNSDEELYALQRQISSVGTLGALSYVIRGLSGLPGRKSVVLFSDGLKVFNTPKDVQNRRDRDQDRLLTQLRSLTDQANRAAVVIYAVDTRGLVYPGLQAADDTSDPNFDAAAVEDDRRDDFLQKWDGMKYLTRHTGGIFYKNTNDLAGAAAAAVADVSGYYLLGYNPDASTFMRDAGRSRYHRLRVKVNRPQLIVRTRFGYYGIPDSAKPPAPTSPEQQLADAISSPFDSGGINLRLTSVFGNDPKLGSYLLSLLHVDAKDLAFTEDPDGTRHAKVEFLSLTYGESQKPEDQHKVTQQIDLKKEDYPNALKWGFVYTIQHQVKKPGAYQVRTAIRDAGSGKVGSASQFVQVPDVTKGGMALSGIMMQTGISGGAGGAAAVQPLAGPAMPVFRPGEPR